MNSRVTSTIRLPGWAEVHFTPVEAVLVKLLRCIGRVDSAFAAGTMKLRCRGQGITLAPAALFKRKETRSRLSRSFT